MIDYEIMVSSRKNYCDKLEKDFKEEGCPPLTALQETLILLAYTTGYSDSRLQVAKNLAEKLVNKKALNSDLK